MKARLVPVYFEPGKDSDFDRQLQVLKRLLSSQAQFLDPVALGAALPQAEAVVFPQLLGEGYRCLEQFKKINIPILIITSEFGTVSMWDWELINYLKSQGIQTIAPYNLDQTKKICASLGVKRELRETKFLVFQDNPGIGAQASIFKRFYWWEDKCTRQIKERFGVSIVRESFEQLGAEAKAIPDEEAKEVWQQWKLPSEGLSETALNSAVKIYMAVKRRINRDQTIRAVGINCLNESHFSDTTPCLAWNMLFEEKGIIWGCEADTLSMLTKYILHKSLSAHIMMTNIYPFLMGDAATKHERIPAFPEVRSEPENHILVAHCGYMGVIPRSFSSEWTLRKKILAIVDDNATAIDARLPEGPVTLAKLDSTLRKMAVVEGRLERYVQFPDSDCLNGGLIRVSDGRKLMASTPSHHYLLMTGHHLEDIRWIGRALDLTIEQI